MRKRMNRYSRIGIVIGIAVAFLGVATLLPDTVLAGQKSKNELPVVDGETHLFPGYPRQYDGHGHIDRVGDNEIVISDNLLPLTSGVDLHTPRNSRASIGRFEAGDYVGYQLDDRGAIESLWLLQKAKR